MKKQKLSLDKLTVAKLSRANNVFGGRNRDYDPTGEGGNDAELKNSSVVCNNNYVNFPANFNNTSISITPPEMRRSSKICAG